MKRLSLYLIFAILPAAFISCSKTVEEFPGDPALNRKVFIFYGCGYNNLSYEIREDIEDLSKHAPKWYERNYSKCLVFAYTSKDSYDWNTPQNPVLIDISRTDGGIIIRDTVKVFPSSQHGSDANTIREVLTYIKERYPAKEYGFLFSSHGTGWLPKGQYSISGNGNGTVPQSSYCDSLPGPLTKTLGADFIGSKTVTSEMEIADFAAAFPMKMKYIILDACLMGGIEEAYELKNITDWFISSQTEVLSDGFDYINMLERLLYTNPSDVRGVCEDYFYHYAKMDSDATVSLVDCRALDGLAVVCKELFEKYRTEIQSVNPGRVQGYFRYNKHWFYDLRDMLEAAGVSGPDMQKLDSALGECVTYKAATDYFMSIRIRTHCGLSIYLPCADGGALCNFYEKFAWNKATEFVK